MRHKIWVYNPHKRKRIISDETRIQTQLACDQFIEKYMRPRFVHPFDPQNKSEPQCIDIQWKWYRLFIYLKAVYKDLRPDALDEIYEYPIARLEYMSENLFHLAYFRHTSKWSQLTYGEGNSLEECLELMQELPHFEVM